MKRLLAILSGAILYLACLIAPALAETMDEVVVRGTLRIGVAQESYMPWIGRDASGALLGFEYDVGQDLSTALGVRPEFVEVPFADVLPALASGRIDVVVSGYTVTAERARSVLFSTPYNSTDYWLVVDTKTLPEGAKEGNYDADGYKVGVIASTVSEELAQSMFTKAEIVPLEDEAAARDALDKGELNAMVVPAPYPTFMMLRQPDRFAVGSDVLFSTVQAMAVRPDSLRFVNYLNAWIAQNEASGRLAEVRDYWFGSLDWEARIAADVAGPEDTPAQNGKTSGAN